MKPIILKMSITLDEECLNSLVDLFRKAAGNVTEDELQRDRRQRASLHAQLGGQKLPEDKLLISTKEVAKLLNLSERTVWGLANSGQMPKSTKIGSSVRWNYDELRAWVDAGCPPEEPIAAPEQRPKRSGDMGQNKVKKLKKATQTNQPVLQTKMKSSQSRKQNKPQEIKPKVPCRTKLQVQEEVDPNPFRLLLKEIGIDRDDLGPLTNGELMQIAEVDLPTFHGWMYQNRDMPEEALEKLRSHFIQFRADAK